MQLVGLAVMFFFSAPALSAGATESAMSSDQLALQKINESVGGAVVMPAMERFVASSKDMEIKAHRLRLSPTPEEFNKFVAQYHEVNEYRELLRAFEFGPVHSLGFSALLDTPTDTGAIEALLANKQLFNKHVANTKPLEKPLLQSMQGFSAIEYIISNWQPMSGSNEYRERQRVLLSRLSQNLYATSLAVYQSWFGSPQSMPAYSSVFSSAGEDGNASYLTVESGSEELIRASINALGGLLEEGLPELSESNPSTMSLPRQTSIRRVRGAVNGVAASYAGQFFSVMYDNNGEAHEVLDEYPIKRSREAIIDSPVAGLSDWVSLQDFETDALIGSSLIAALDIIDTLYAKASLESEQHQTLVDDLIVQLTEAQQLLEEQVLPLAQPDLDISQ